MKLKIITVIIILSCLLLFGCSSKEENDVTTDAAVTEPKAEGENLNNNNTVENTAKEEESKATNINSPIPRLIKSTKNTTSILVRYQKDDSVIKRNSLIPNQPPKETYIDVGNNKDLKPVLSVTINGFTKDLLRDRSVMESDFISTDYGYEIHDGTIIQVEYRDVIDQDGVDEVIMALGDAKSKLNIYIFVYDKKGDHVDIWAHRIYTGTTDAFLLDDRISIARDLYGTYYEDIFIKETVASNNNSSQGKQISDSESNQLNQHTVPMSYVGKYYSEENNNDYIELKSNGEVVIDEDNAGYFGEYEVNGQTLLLKIEGVGGIKGTIKDGVLIDPEGIRWKK